LSFIGGPRWLAAYGVVIGLGAAASVLALVLTVTLFRLIGPKRTRLVAQIVAAVIGAAFVIGLQIAAIQSYGTLSRIAILQSDALLARAPSADSAIYLPARAALGDGHALFMVLAVSLIALGLAAIGFSARFGDHAIAAAGAAPSLRRHRRAGFRLTSPRRALRRKEWTLLLRDPWLVSQSLLQLLYLVPPALMLWKSFSDGNGALLLLVPVLVMAAGQLAGGLAWLAISGEDAPDLVATAPLPAAWILRAKIEAVMGAVALIFTPFLAALAWMSPVQALVAALGIAAGSAAASAIQLWFRTQARRSHFRRRQTSSRLATFTEAFSSITIAATAGLAAAGTWFAAVTAAIVLLILLGARLLAPRGRPA
jgi:ABC-2 type transport system permease protein